ncbi:hypothetical protein [Pseudanabaena sp. FACHB-2040]|uniref:hypothetical protein n=1 Tax=Pseudanabaena sp. FACHB-2040 TaxID=2692859 RepID=UPI00168401B2|nr:hypothetical protein [Pseudanabaena sp. FACHB-2040]MBD2261399.1 hypothetical protein [Pseudanabaena sp. FACHB-2040]
MKTFTTRAGWAFTGLFGLCALVSVSQIGIALAMLTMATSVAPPTGRLLGKYSVPKRLLIRSLIFCSAPLVSLIATDPAAVEVAAAPPVQQVAAAPEPAPALEAPAGIGLSRAGFQSIFEKPEIGFVFEQSSPVGGQPRVQGTSENNLVHVELIGPDNELTQATMIAGLPNDDDYALAENSVHLTGFMHLASPGWDGGKDWLRNGLDTLASTSDTEIQTAHDGKTYTLSFSEDLGFVMLVVKPAG